MKASFIIACLCLVLICSCEGFEDEEYVPDLDIPETIDIQDGQVGQFQIESIFVPDKAKPNLDIHISSDRQFYFENEPIVIEVSISNLGQEPEIIAFIPHWSSGDSVCGVFNIENALKIMDGEDEIEFSYDIVEPWKMDKEYYSSPYMHTIPAGESLQECMIIGDPYYDLPSNINGWQLEISLDPGWYKIQFSYFVEYVRVLWDNEEYEKYPREFKKDSNTIDIRIDKRP
jgi:hypothetical protein